MFKRPLFISIALALAVVAFNPRGYEKQTVKCPAVKRFPKPETNVDIKLSYVDINPPNAKDTIVMVHGWPGLWSTWSKQIELLKDDYRLIAVDQRGFGQSEHPGDPLGSSTMSDLVGDIVCILEHEKVNKAMLFGHDWGSQVSFEAARMRPDIFTAVVAISVPHLPADGSFPIIRNLLPNLPKLSYQVYFDEHTQKATKELDQDIRRSIRATLRTVNSTVPDDFLTSEEDFLGAYAFVKEIPPVPFFTTNEEDYFVEQYSLQGFKYTLGFYTHRNKYDSWNLAHKQGNHTIPQPALVILPEQDPVADWKLVSRAMRSEKYLIRGTTKYVEGSHWVHLENSAAVNELIKDWLFELSEQKVTEKERGEAHLRAVEEL